MSPILSFVNENDGLWKGEGYGLAQHYQASIWDFSHSQLVKGFPVWTESSLIHRLPLPFVEGSSRYKSIGRIEG